VFRNGDVSYWYRDVPVSARRDPLPGDRAVDVAVVGGGFTGLWAAYYLKRADPALDIAVIEREFAGFGASGRNGGWLSSRFAGSLERYAKASGRAAVLALMRAMRHTVDEVVAVARAEGIDADIVNNGVLFVARSPAQLRRLREDVAYHRSWGETEEHIRILERDELETRVRVEGALAATHSPDTACVQPAKLVRGLAAAVERLGVRIFEQTTARAIAPRTVHTDRGTVTASHVLRCLEGFTASIEGQRRAWLPMNSSMVVTEPLPDAAAARIGWRNRELLGDFAHAYMYAQRTADGRIALGGRGRPYRYASRTDDNGRTQDATVAALTRLLHTLFPAAAQVPIAHAWCGVLGVPRDWCTTVTYDRATGIGAAGGYVGNGVAATNLAGRTLADLVLGVDSELTRLPWVDRRVRKWEPEPIRWLGVHAMYAMYRHADRREYRSASGATNAVARFADAISGR
jgi:glycine/D-amino acid oxidase-like deaminating enzyme